MNKKITITTSSITAPSSQLLHETAAAVYLDATRASVKLHGQDIFAPPWSLVLSYQRGRVTADSYTKQYHRQMQQSYHAHRAQWHAVLAASAGKRLVIGCFCKPGAFCHRHLLADYLAQVARQQGYQVNGEAETAKANAAAVQKDPSITARAINALNKHLKDLYTFHPTADAHIIHVTDHINDLEYTIKEKELMVWLVAALEQHT